jgi:hypothetical protein
MRSPIRASIPPDQLRQEWATQTARTRTTPLPPRCARLTGQKSDVSNSMQLLADEVIE